MERTPHIPGLDGLRGLAVLLVLLYHFQEPVVRMRPFGWLTPAVASGWVGVDIFFVLSGFLITGILLQTRGLEHYFRNFYARRALRIVPVYAVAVGLFFALLPLAHSHGKDLALHEQEQLWYWLFLENWRTCLGYNDGAQLSHLWSVAIEEQFYLAWSVVVAVAGGARFPRLCLALIVLGALLTAILWHMGVPLAFLNRSTLTRMDGLLLGSLLAASPQARRLASRSAPWLLALGVANLAAFVHGHPNALLHVLNSLAAAGMLARACEGGFPLLSSPVLRNFGKYSYAIYVFHYPVQSVLAPLAGRVPALAFAIFSLGFGTAVSYGLARVSWSLLEQPLLKKKQLFAFPGQNESSHAL